MEADFDGLALYKIHMMKDMFMALPMGSCVMERTVQTSKASDDMAKYKEDVVIGLRLHFLAPNASFDAMVKDQEKAKGSDDPTASFWKVLQTAMASKA